MTAALETAAIPRLEIRGLDMAYGDRVIQRNLSFSGRATLSEPAGDSYEAMAAAHSRLLAALARDLAAALNQAAGAGSRAEGR